MNAAIDFEPIYIPFNKKKLILLLGGSVILVFLGFWFVIDHSAFKDQFVSERYETVILLIGLLAFVFFGACSFFIFKKLYDQLPGLTLDKNGFTDNSSGIPAGFISWSDIVGFRKLEIHHQQVIMVHLKDPDAFLGNQHNVVRRAWLRLNYKLYGAPIGLSSNGLECDLPSLYKMLTTNWQRFKEHID